MAVEPVAAVGVVDDEDFDDRGGGRHDNHVGGAVRRPSVAPLARGALLSYRVGERVAAGTAHARPTVVIDEDGRAGLQNGLVAGGGSVAVAVVGDAGVQAELYGGE